MRKFFNGFTLIELLVVISIIGVIIGISFFGLTGARESARDARRRADLEQIRSGLELYKADCNDYPVAVGGAVPSPLVGDGSPSTCSGTNVYIASVPRDPADPTRLYYYSRPTATTYLICASLEQSTAGVPSGCGSCGTSCNYGVTNP